MDSPVKCTILASGPELSKIRYEKLPSGDQGWSNIPAGCGMILKWPLQMMNWCHALLFSHCRFCNWCKEEAKFLISLLAERILLWQGSSPFVHLPYVSYLFIQKYFFGLFSSLLRTSLWNLEDPVLRKMIRQVRQITDTQLLYCTVLQCGSFRSGERLTLFFVLSLACLWGYLQLCPVTLFWY